ncbi:MAG: hypothetical protein ACJ78Q_04990, partial [Chloroflexia bacterium]
MDEHLGLLIRKGDPLTVRVVMHLDAYRALMTVSRARRPYEVAGVLIGTWAGFQDQHWVTVEDVMPLRLVPAEDDLAPDEEDIQRLTDRLTRARPDSDKDGSSDNNGEGHQSSSSGHEAEEGLRVVGSFYADPDLAARPPRLNLYGVHQALAPDTQLFLLIDPAINEGVYYLWESRYLAPVGGFYELLPPGASPEIPWGGGWSGADLARGLDREVPEASGDLIAVSTSLPPAYASRHRLPSFLLAALEHGLGATRHSRLAWGLAVAVELMLFSLLFLVGTLALPGGPAFHPDIAIVSTSASAPPLSQVLPLQGGGVPANPPDTATPDVSVRQAEATRAAQVTRVTRPQPTQTSVPALAPTLPPPPPSISTFPPPTPTGEGPAQASVFESNHTLTLPDSACTGGYTLP